MDYRYLANQGYGSENLIDKTAIYLSTLLCAVFL